MSVVIIGGNECMVCNALFETKGQDVKVVRSHTSSMSALKNILEENAKQEKMVCLMKSKMTVCTQ